MDEKHHGKVTTSPAPAEGQTYLGGHAYPGPELGEQRPVWRPPSSTQRRRITTRQVKKTAVALAYYGYIFWIIDISTGRQLSMGIKVRAQHVRNRIHPPTYELPAPLVTQLHAEARRITEEAARARNATT